MKKIIALLLASLMVFGMAACTPAENSGGDTTGAGDAAPQDIALKVWGPQNEIGENKDGWLPKMCEAFDEAHPEWNITWTYEVCGEGDAGTKVTQDPTVAGDIYFFANDQLGTLLQANAIARLGGDTLAQVKADNTPEMVASVTSGEGVYGVPFTTNTWFMFYDKSAFSADDVKSLETMLSKGKVAFPLTTGWYFGSFYVANGGTFFGDGTDASKGIDFSGDKGVAVTKYLVDLVKNPNFINDVDQKGLSGLADGSVDAFFSGTWDAEKVKKALGDNWAAAVPPTIKIDGAEKQITPFGGSKAIAVNPNSAQPKAAAALAAYLGSPEAQLAHYTYNGTAPVSVKLMAEDATIKADLSCAIAVETVGKYSVVQPSIPEMGLYWGAAEAMAKAIYNGEVTADNAVAKTADFNTSLNTASEG